MVYLLAKSVVLCLLLDQRGDPAVVREFVREEWSLLQEVLLPSELQHVHWIWRRLTNQVEARQRQSSTNDNDNDNSSNGERNDGVVVGMNAVSLTPAPLTNVVARLTARDVLRYLKDREHHSPTQPAAGESSSGGGNDSRPGSRNTPTAGEASKQPCVTAEQLWVVKCLTTLVRRALALQAQHVLPPLKTSSQRRGGGVMKRTGHLHKSSKKKHADADEGKEEENEEEDSDVGYDQGVFRHACSVLVPLRVCRHVSGFSLRQVVELCLLSDEAAAGGIVLKKREVKENKRADCGNAALALIINPAVLIRDNPRRIEKNKLVDRIQHSVLSQCYETMARTGKGGIGSNSNSGNTLPVISTYRQQQQQREAAVESFASFLRDVSIGFDMQVMALSGGVVGYYLAHLHGMPTGMCIVFATVGLILMLFVDAVLFILRMGKVDAQTRKEKRKRWKVYTTGTRREGREREERPQGEPQPVGRNRNVTEEEEEEETENNDRDVDLYVKKNA